MWVKWKYFWLGVLLRAKQLLSDISHEISPVIMSLRLIDCSRQMMHEIEMGFNTFWTDNCKWNLQILLDLWALCDSHRILRTVRENTEQCTIDAISGKSQMNVGLVIHLTFIWTLKIRSPQVAPLKRICPTCCEFMTTIKITATF